MCAAAEQSKFARGFAELWTALLSRWSGPYPAHHAPVGVRHLRYGCFRNKGHLFVALLVKAILLFWGWGPFTLSQGVPDVCAIIGSLTLWETIILGVDASLEARLRGFLRE